MLNTINLFILSFIMKLVIMYTKIKLDISLKYYNTNKNNDHVL